ncbi:hypothetical protein BDV98DRAFT_318220 [Pterulicium gracile]|uniref:F-box domain-containing protein n=1 Tax=Pterulicium gracile TaxID=1884261 RepID=A0A5C3QVD6_9AGAR|nr:hypothetical protein BDV98DRAFT_318220 [Pterula gracilis]
MFSSPSFLTLPTELICTILHCLDISDLLRCVVVNKHLRSIISNSSSLQYTLELGAHKFTSVLPLSVGPSAAKRLQCLREREHAWRTLKWRGKRSFDLPAPGSVYEFVGGYYGNGRDDDRKLTGSLSFFQLPTHGIDMTQQTWTHPFPEVTIIDFTMDPAQDLLVIVSLAPPESKHIYQMHLRTLSSNQPHPKAPLPIFGSVSRIPPDDPQVNESSAASVRIQVVGNIVALLVKQVVDHIPAHLEIWDWNVASQHSVSLQRPSGIDDFTLLSKDTFLIVRPSGMLEVLSFEDPAVSSQKPRTRAVYELPTLSEGFIYWYISLTSNPSVGPNPRTKCPCSCSKISSNTTYGPRSQLHDPQPPPDDDGVCLHCPMYYPSAEDRIHACCLYVLNPAGPVPAIEQVHSFVFFIDVSTFLIHSPSYDISRIKLRADILSTALSFNGSARRNSTAPGGALFASASPQPGSSSSPTPRRASSAPPASQHTEHIIRPIRWEQWGPTHTRWFRERISTDWQHALYGYRTVETIGLTRAERQRELQDRLDAFNANASCPHGQSQNGVQGSGPANGTAAFPSSPPELTFEFLPEFNPLDLMAGEQPLEASSSSTSADEGPVPQVHDADSLPDYATAANNHDNEDPLSISDDDEDAGVTPLTAFRDGKRRLRVRDFNPHHTRRSITTSKSKSKGKQRQQVEDWDHCTPLNQRKGAPVHLPDSMFEERLISKPSIVPSRGVFVRDIISALPYREVLSRETFHVSDVMLDECRILLLKRAAQDGQLLGIDVLMM